MNPYEDRLFDELVTKECLQTITTREKRELNRLQRIRNKEIDAQMDLVDPGWRKRELAWRRKVNKLIKWWEKAK
jgi:hypothetical protein